MRNRSVIIVVFLALIGGSVYSQNTLKKGDTPQNTDYKMGHVMEMIRRFYVEKVSMNNIVEKGIIEMLRDLDPHSSYISSEEVERANEPLVGNFDGIGVSFQIIKDTITVVEVISGGPSEKVGIQAGDKIVSIDDKKATGDTISNSFVLNNLRGKKGTVVNVGIKRRSRSDLLYFKITRDKIPLNSIDTYYMLDKKVGYIKLDRFSRTSLPEFRAAVDTLKKQGMSRLVFDLRGNGGGFLDVAISLSDEFLEKDKLIVFTEGVASPKQSFSSSSVGNFEKGRLVVLVDEGSASASEIVSGAVQDWDRGIIVGRRSFGKGLVQRMFDLPDQSQVRLTTSKYYTPSGRCIQKPYKDGVEAYYNDFVRRMNHKELVTSDSIMFPDSLRYLTKSKRVVYGGGGIMPDVFVPIDTLRVSDYYIDIRSKGLMNDFSLEWANNHRDVLTKYPSYETFYRAYKELGVEDEFHQYVSKAGVNKNVVKNDFALAWIYEEMSKMIKDTNIKMEYDSYEVCVNKLLSHPEFVKKIKEKSKVEDANKQLVIEKSDEFISAQLEAMIIRNLYGIKYYYQAISAIDDGLKKALEVINNDNFFDKDVVKVSKNKRNEKKN